MGGAFQTASGGVLDLNDAGDLTSPTTNSSNVTTPNIASATASLTNTNTGRIGLAVAVSGGKTFEFAAYLFNYIAADGSPSTGAVLLETDTNVGVGTGVAVSYTHLDVYKRQELRSLHEFIPEHVVHPWFDEHVGLTTPRLIRDSLNN